MVAKTGMSKSTIYALIKAGEFAAPIKCTTRKSGWILSEIDQWIEDKRLSRDAAKEA